MDYFEEHGWDVHVIDVSPITIPEAYNIVKTGIIEHPRRELFTTKKAFREYAKKIPDGAVFILTADFIYYIYFVIRCIRKTQYYGYMTRIDTNVEPDPQPTKNRIRNLFGKGSFARIRNAIFTRIPKKWFPVKPASFIWLGGRANKNTYIGLEYIDEKTHISFLHSMDYDQYLAIKDLEERVVEERYAVLIDDYLPYHPDVAMEGIVIDPDTYYDQMVSFLRSIEKKYGFKVVIAIHPRSDEDLCRKSYPGFEIYKFKTAQLVKDAELVISHFSTALDFAAVFYKPVIVCTTDRLLEIYEWNNCGHKYADYFGTKLLNVSSPDSYVLSDKLSVDKDKYNYFVEHYMKGDRNAPDKRLGEMMYDDLCGILEGK